MHVFLPPGLIQQCQQCITVPPALLSEIKSVNLTSTLYYSTVTVCSVFYKTLFHPGLYTNTYA